ncbi:MAG: prepilin-type N-terminal cleavage/methylation domain-containing protein [Lachnospiraceae bacterium]|nr:prepilin-type N-terminal cleavage/methylation domain-containing protein [Lachnospiraceae bacterium]
MLNKLRKNNKKGFTLVELIVVLVILAILAALLIPALTRYIDKAKQKDIIAKTRQVVMATQTLADEAYAQNATLNATWVTNNNTAILDLAEVTGTITNPAFTPKGAVEKLTFSDGTMTCTYDTTATELYTIN